MENDYDYDKDSYEAHKRCLTAIEKLLPIADRERKNENFTELIITYKYIEEIAQSLQQSAKILKNIRKKTTLTK